MANQSESKLVVVTGAVGALGGSLVRFLAGRGYRVLAVARPESSAGLAELGQIAGVIPVGLDVSSERAWTEALPRLASAHGVPSGAVLAAGAYRGGARLFEGSERDKTFRAMLEANLETARVSLQALLGPMVTAKSGSVVLVGSRAGVRPWESEGSAAYAVSKAAVVALTQAAAREVLEDGVRVNAVLPSTLDTPANRKAMPRADASRWVSLESLSGVIEFLLSDAARDVSGALLPVYGQS